MARSHVEVLNASSLFPEKVALYDRCCSSGRIRYISFLSSRSPLNTTLCLSLWQGEAHQLYRPLALPQSQGTCCCERDGSRTYFVVVPDRPASATSCAGQPRRERIFETTKHPTCATKCTRVPCHVCFALRHIEHGVLSVLASSATTL